MTGQRITVLSVVFTLIALIVFLCVLTFFRISKPASKLRKEATRYEQYKKNFDSMLSFMNLSEVKELRVMVNDYHVEVAQKFGVGGLIDETAVIKAVEDGKLIHLSETRFWRIKELKDSLPYVTPDTFKLLQLIGEKFQENLKKNNLPLYRFTISSVLRTDEGQKRLTRKNRNATKNTSSHQFGTSVDILFKEFDYTGEDNFTFNFLKRYGHRPELKKKEFDEMGILYAQRLKTILGRTLLDLQREGKCYVIYEIRQPVFHVTVAAKF
ncbi:MAG: DUF5715 family protein [Candidatus Omnitrophica bacterium]|nr:DUF5715 family protein [Candidatus Omnitrophota bacterium]